MLFEINTNASSLKSFSGINRASNLLQLAVSRLSDGVRTNNSSDDATGLGLADNFDESHREILQKSPSDLGSIKTQDFMTDQILASPGGLARMEAMLPDASTSAGITNPAFAVDTAFLSRKNIIENPETALRSQANQLPNTVMKLLE